LVKKPISNKENVDRGQRGGKMEKGKNQVGSSEKKPFASPKLVKYGRLADITQRRNQTGNDSLAKT
jgi:hypothetical protein